METKNEEIQKVEKSQKANKEPKTNSKNYLKTYYEKNKLKMQKSDKDYKIVTKIVTKIVVEF